MSCTLIILQNSVRFDTDVFWTRGTGYARWGPSFSPLLFRSRRHRRGQTNYPLRAPHSPDGRQHGRRYYLCPSQPSMSIFFPASVVLCLQICTIVWILRSTMANPKLSVLLNLPKPVCGKRKAANGSTFTFIDQNYNSCLYRNTKCFLCSPLFVTR